MMLTKVNLSELQVRDDATYDLFICSSSFESRCLSIPLNIDVNKIRRALIVSNIEPLEYVSANQKKLEDRFGRKGQVVKTTFKYRYEYRKS